MKILFSSVMMVALSAFTAAWAENGPGQGDATVPSVPACKINVSGWLDRLQVPGLSVGIIKNGQLLCVGTAGFANIDKNIPVRPDTVFAWASVSKTVTATAAMILFDQGKFRLDDDIDKFLPFSVRNPNCPSKPITFRHLLTHTSSIVDNHDVYGASYTKGDSPIALGDFVRNYVLTDGDYYDEEQNFSSKCPGRVYKYSNIAVGLLGYLVEQIAGVPFDEFCEQSIFKPLGMTETSFHLAHLNLDQVAMPYKGHSPLGHVGFPTYPDGLLRTSVPHMARILAMMSGGGQYAGQRILKEATVREMKRVQYPDLDDTQGLIWHYDDDNSRLFGHTGSDPGTASRMFYDSRDGTGAIMVANGDWEHSDDDSSTEDALFKALMKEGRESDEGRMN